MNLASVEISCCTGQIPIIMTSILSLYSVEGLERVSVLYRFLRNPFGLCIMVRPSGKMIRSCYYHLREHSEIEDVIVSK